MSAIAKLLSFVRAKVDGKAHVTDVKADPGGGANVTAHHFAPPGDDSHPLPGDFVALAESPGSGNMHATGYIDPANEPKAEAGGKRIYSRDANGKVVAEAWLKADGTIVVNSVEGGVTLTLGADGTAKIEGGVTLTLDASGTATLEATSVEVDAPQIVLAPGGELAVARQTDPVVAGPYAGTIQAGSTKTKSG